MRFSIAWAANSVKKTFSDEDVYFRRNSSRASLGIRTSKREFQSGSAARHGGMDQENRRGTG